MSELKIDDSVNELCPWSGKPVSADSLTLYRGHVVGFCNPGCREKFDKAVQMFEEKLTVSEVVKRVADANLYRQREFTGFGSWSIDDHHLKVYGISLGDAGERVRELLPHAQSYAQQVLSSASSQEGESAKLGYVILHAGEAGSWLLIHWWAHQDIVCQLMALAAHGESRFQSVSDRPLHACVWEQVVIHHESKAWVRHMLTMMPDSVGYLRDTLKDGLY